MQNGGSLRAWFRKLTNRGGEEGQAGAPAAPEAAPDASPPPPPPPPPMPGTEADAGESPAAAAAGPAVPDAEPDVARLLRGVDVSSFQGLPGNWKHEAGPISWAAVKITELEPNGVHYVNPDAAADWAYLDRQNLNRVAYLFGHPSVNAGDTVTFFLSQLHRLGLRDEDGIALDLEVTDGLGPAAVAAWARNVAGQLHHRTGRRPVIYTFLSFAESGNCAGLGSYPLWIADPSSPAGHPRVPGPWRHWTMHQHSITGSIDRDVAKFDSLAAMRAGLGKRKESHVHNLGGSNTSALAAIRWENGVTVVAGLGKDGFIQATRFDGKWSAWKNVSPGKAIHPPAMISWGKGTAHLYYTSEQGDVIELVTGNYGQHWS
jgi:GH25 family lysozyme M1 (1,4-beta-N-acetylmuramidase)